jgi:hypothetical protein
MSETNSENRNANGIFPQITSHHCHQQTSNADKQIRKTATISAQFRHGASFWRTKMQNQTVKIPDIET